MNLSRPRRCRRGFTLFEVILALAIFTAMITMVGAMIPITIQAVRYSADYNQAQGLVLKKIAQLQEAGYSNMDAPTLGQSGMDIVDGTPSTPATNANGDQTGSFEFTTTDNLWRFFPGGQNANGTQNTTSAQRPRGYIFIEPFTPSAVSGSSPVVYTVIRATVVVQWWNTRGRMQSYASSTLLSQTPVL